MTAKTKHGHGAHRAAHGADPGTPHERLNRLHAMPGRPEGAMAAGMGSGAPMGSPAPMPPMAGGGAPPMGAPPMGAPPMGAPPMGTGPGMDEEGEQS